MLDNNNYENINNEENIQLNSTNIEEVVEPINIDYAQEEDNVADKVIDVINSDTKKEKKPKRKRFKFLRKVIATATIAAVFGVVLQGTLIVSKPVLSDILAQYGFATERDIKLSTTLSNQNNVTPVSNNNNSVVDSDSLIPNVAEDVNPSIVSITSKTTQRDWFNNLFEADGGSGSGIIIANNNSELLIVTNQHVIANTTKLQVTFIDQTSATATIKGSDADSDLAVISVKISDLNSDTLNNIKIATLGDSDKLRVGERAIAIGNPLGYSHTLTAGFISAVKREVQTDTSTLTLIQTDAAINPGNSGGALINIKGEVIGINVLKFASNDVEGMGFAIPINTAKPIIDEIINQKPKAYIGIQGQDVTDEIAAMYKMPKGIYVVDIVKGSPAANANLQLGDIITEINGVKIGTMKSLQQELKKYAPKDEVNLKVTRRGQSNYEDVTISIKLAEKPAF